MGIFEEETEEKKKKIERAQEEVGPLFLVADREESETKKTFSEGEDFAKIG